MATVGQPNQLLMPQLAAELGKRLLAELHSTLRQHQEALTRRDGQISDIRIEIDVRRRKPHRKGLYF